MKKLSLACVCATMLLLNGSAAWAFLLLPPHGYITITECDSPGPDPTSVDIINLTGTSSASAIPGVEYGIASVTLTSVSNSGFLFSGTRYLRLLEADSTAVSDVVKLQASNVAYVGGNYIQTFVLSFFSDGYASFATYLAASAGSPEVAETGNLQDVSGDTLLNTNDAFGLFVQSGSCQVPLPGTLLLLGSALIGLAGCRKRKS